MNSVIDRYALPTLHVTRQTFLNGTTEVQVGEQMQSQIGMIYGISTITDGVSPNNQTMITQSESSEIYLVLKRGSSEFINRIRLDQLNFANDSDIGNCNRYLPVHIPGTTDLDTSYYMNPTGINNAYIVLNFFYIEPEVVNWLVDINELPPMYKKRPINDGGTA